MVVLVVDDPGACPSTCRVGWGKVAAGAVVVDELLGMTGSDDDKEGPPGWLSPPLPLVLPLLLP